MDVKAYIASGILQDYAAGLVTEQEHREVQCLSKIYPEVATALAQAEDDLETFASAYAQKAPDSLRNRVLAEVKKHAQESPLKVVSQKIPVEAIKPVTETSGGGASPLIWLLAAACIGAVGFAVWQYNENGNSQERIAQLTEWNAGAAERLDVLEADKSSLQSEVNDAFRPEIRKIVLKAVQEGGLESLAILWNTSTGEVKYDPSGLPALPANKQYQLWVLKDGVPSDMGVVPKDFNSLAFSSPIKVLAGDAFAITLEPLGGQPTPSLDQLVVMGTV